MIVQGYSIKIENVEKKFGDHTVLKDINLEMEAGEYVAIVG